MKRMTVALLLSFAVACLVGAQKKSDTEKPTFQAIRIEKAKISNQSGKWVEGSRVLFSNSTYDTKGNLSESNVYKSDGSLYSKYVSTYGANGKKTEEIYFNAKGSVLDKIVYTHDAVGRLTEKLHYGTKQSPMGKSVLKRDLTRITEMIRYDAKGSLESKTTYTYHDTDNRIEISYYDSKGTLNEKSTDAYNSAGELMGSASYQPNGSRIAMSAYVYDGNGNVVEEAFYNVDGLSKWRYTYDSDSNGNWVKQTTSHLVNKSGTLIYEPTDLTYRTITYYSGLSKTDQPDDSSLANKVEVSETRSVLRGVTIKRVEPAYPQQAAAARITGAVIVQILIEEDGNVISARAMLGDSLLREASEAAAWHWKFTPTLVGGEPSRARANAVFNFAGR